MIEQPSLTGAACAARGVDPELFMPNGSGTQAKARQNAAKAICRSCPVQLECLTWALERIDRRGIWGGTTQGQRRTILKSRRPIEEAIKEINRGHSAWTVYQDNTRVIEDGHTEWTGTSRNHVIDGEQRSTQQIAFAVKHGRYPTRKLRTTCGRPGCHTPEHLTDTRMYAATFAKAA